MIYSFIFAMKLWFNIHIFWMYQTHQMSLHNVLKVDQYHQQQPEFHSVSHRKGNCGCCAGHCSSCDAYMYSLNVDVPTVLVWASQHWKQMNNEEMNCSFQNALYWLHSYFYIRESGFILDPNNDARCNNIFSHKWPPGHHLLTARLKFPLLLA